jgi:heme o synthase
MSAEVSAERSAAAPSADPVAAPLAAPPAEAEQTRTGALSRVAAYVALTKPRIIELLLVTTVPPMFLAAGGWPGGWLILATLIGGTITAGAANAYNMVYDRDIDAVMVRTRGRPLPSGRISVRAALVFATVLAVVGPLWLWWTVNLPAAALSTAAMVFYVGVYSAWLKRSTVHNIVIGGAAGAVPALVGWAAVTGTVPLAAWVLFTVVFLWTPPHFWALAIVCDRDYAAVGVPMLPVVHGRAETATRALRYAVATVGVSLLLPLTDARVGLLYVAIAAVAGAELIRRSVHLRRDPVPAVARRLFTFSITYLTVLFGGLIVDQLVVLPG